MTAITKTDVLVYAHWQPMITPRCIGILTAQHAKGKKTFSFQYDPEWLRSGRKFSLDPDIGWFGGPQYPYKKENFGIFADAMPDSWGRKLLQRRAAQKATEEKKPVRTLYELDFLLGVHDFTRMGALRFKTDPEGPFLDNDVHRPAPPWASIRDLQYSAKVFEEDAKGANKKWLELLLAPGSSLGGARPKANIVDESGQLWIAKFPSVNDVIDKGAWEYLAYVLAVQSGVDMSECRVEKIYGNHHTFFTKRFDRHKQERVHFSSAMTMTGYHEELIKDHVPSYLEIAEVIQRSGTNSKTDLHRLWRRMVFNVAVSNTDDHLRNHGFLLGEKAWQLSPAYDLNPSIDKTGLGLNIDMDQNDLDIDLARSVGEYFKLSPAEMETIIEEVRVGTENWKEVANAIGISRNEQELMAGAFTFDRQTGIAYGYMR